MQILHYYAFVVHNKALEEKAAVSITKVGGSKRMKDRIESFLDLAFKVVPPHVFELFTSFLINKVIVKDKKSFYPYKFVKYLGRGGQSLVFEVSTNQNRRIAYKVFQYSRLSSNHKISKQRRQDFYQDTKLYKDKYILHGDTYLKGVIRTLKKDIRWLDFHYKSQLSNFVVLNESYSLVLDPITNNQRTISVTQKLVDLSGKDVFSEDFLLNQAYKMPEGNMLPLTLFYKRVLFTAENYGYVVDLLGNKNFILTESNSIVCVDPHNIYKVCSSCSRFEELIAKLSKIYKFVDRYS